MLGGNKHTPVIFRTSQIIIQELGKEQALWHSTINCCWGHINSWLFCHFNPVSWLCASWEAVSDGSCSPFLILPVTQLGQLTDIFYSVLQPQILSGSHSPIFFPGNNNLSCSNLHEFLCHQTSFRAFGEKLNS